MEKRYIVEWKSGGLTLTSQVVWAASEHAAIWKHMSSDSYKKNADYIHEKHGHVSVNQIDA